MKKFASFTVLMLITMAFTGCWDYKELELLDFVYGVGVDSIDPEFTLIAEIMKSVGAGQDADFQSVVLSTKGRSVSSSGIALQNLAAMALFWPHAQVFVVSEEVARSGVLPAIEFLIRGADLRSSVYFFVSRDCTVEELFQSAPVFEASVSQHLANLVRLHEDTPIFFPQQMWEFTRTISKQGISATLPTVKLVQNGDDEVAVIRGTAIFNTDYMVDWLNEEESEIFCLIKGLKHRGRFVMDTLVDGQDIPLTYEIRGNQAKTKIDLIGQQIKGVIDISLQLDLIEIQNAKIDLLDPQLILFVEAQLNAAFTRRIRELLVKLQGNKNCDPIGWGQLLKQNHKEVWRENMSDWCCILADLDVEINVEAKITSTGVTGKSTPVRY